MATTRSLAQYPGDSRSYSASDSVAIADTSTTFQASTPSDVTAFGADNFDFPDAINLLAPMSAQATALAGTAVSLTPGVIVRSTTTARPASARPTAPGEH